MSYIYISAGSSDCHLYNHSVLQTTSLSVKLLSLDVVIVRIISICLMQYRRVAFFLQSFIRSEWGLSWASCSSCVAVQRQDSVEPEGAARLRSSGSDRLISCQSGAISLWSMTPLTRAARTSFFDSIFSSCNSSSDVTSLWRFGFERRLHAFALIRFRPICFQSFGTKTGISILTS